MNLQQVAAMITLLIALTMAFTMMQYLPTWITNNAFFSSLLLAIIFFAFSLGFYKYGLKGG